MTCSPKNEYLKEDATILEIGTGLDNGKYKIIDILGKGGFGIVYKVRRVSDFKILAVKELLISSNAICFRKYDSKISTKNPKIFNAFKEKVKKEVEFFSKIENKNPNIINVYGFFEDNNTVYTVMEYINGCDLEELVLNKEFYFTEHDILDLLQQLSNGFEKIHKKNIIHRDIKPNNIIRTNSGTYKLIDFTNIKMFLEEERGVITEIAGLNAKFFSPPELTSKIDKDIGVYSDIYSLGITVYCCLNGRFDAPDANQRQVDDTFQKDINRLDISTKYKSVITKMTELNKNDRFQSLDEVLEYLDSDEPCYPWYKFECIVLWFKNFITNIKNPFSIPVISLPTVSFPALSISSISLPSISLPSISLPTFDFGLLKNGLVNLLKVLGVIVVLFVLYKLFQENDKPSLNICDTQQKMKVCKERYRQIAFGKNPNLLDLDEFEELVKAGVPINEIKNKSDETALHNLAFKGKYEFVKVLVDTDNIDVNIKDNQDETALLEAIAIANRTYVTNQNRAVIRLLLDSGASIHVKSKKRSGNSILSYAVKYKLVDIVEELVNRGICSYEKGMKYGIDKKSIYKLKEIRYSKTKKAEKIKEILKKGGC